jgi:hypothetical protein
VDPENVVTTDAPSRAIGDAALKRWADKKSCVPFSVPNPDRRDALPRQRASIRFGESLTPCALAEIADRKERECAIEPSARARPTILTLRVFKCRLSILTIRASSVKVELLK